MTATVTVDAAGLGPEAAAREARYAVLEEVAARTSAAVVLLGHTLDDQAETVLLGLARGSGGRSLAGMRRRFDVFARPLLDVRRDDTVTACQVEGLAGLGGPAQHRPRLHPGAGAPPACCRCSRTSSAPASPPPWPAPPTSCATTWACSTSSPPRWRPRSTGEDGLAVDALAGQHPVAAPPRAPRRRRSPPAPPPPRCTTSTSSPSTRCSPTGGARSGSTSPATCAPYAATACSSSSARPRPRTALNFHAPARSSARWIHSSAGLPAPA